MILGEIGESLQIVVRKTDDTILNDVNWDDIVWSEVKEIGLKGSHHIIGFHKNLGCITWYPRIPYTYDKPLFYIYQKAWGKISGTWHRFYITDSNISKTPYHQTNDNIAPDERKMGWTGTVTYGGNDFDVDVAILAEPLGLPQSLKTKITTPIDLEDSGIEYQFYLNPDFVSDIQKNIKWIRVFTTWDLDNPENNVYTDYNITQLMEITNIPSLDTYIFEFYNNDKSKRLGHFDFNNIFMDSNNRLIKIEEVTLPNNETTYCMRIGASFGALSSGETLEVDPWFGYQGENTSGGNCNNRSNGLYVSTASDGAGNITTIDAYYNLWTDSNGECNTRCALFNSDKSLIAETGDIFYSSNTSSFTDWITHTFSTPVAVSASTEYIIAVASDSDGSHSNVISYNDTDSLAIDYKGELDAAPAFDDPIDGTKYTGYTLSIYANYADTVSGSVAYIKTKLM